MDRSMSGKPTVSLTASCASHSAIGNRQVVESTSRAGGNHLRTKQLFGTFMADEKLSGQQKRQYYVVAFCFAVGIDLLTSFIRDAPYRPSLVGMAIMIAAVLYFVASCIRER